MNNIEYLIGSYDIKKTPMQIFSDEACGFLAEVSDTLLKSQESRIYPDLTALAFWCRNANIKKIKSEYTDSETRLGRGLCFHIAPSNIPINFAFSFFFSLLAGNSNIVRLPSKSFSQVDFLCKVFKTTLEKFPEIKARTVFVKYPVNNEITAEFSKNADCRMIWGGDKTINSVRKLDTKPRCVDIAFADRYSICIIDGQKILEADDAKFQRLSEDFYNDTYLMDQNACSSPQLILWVNDDVKARTRFWDCVYATASKKYNLQDAVSVDKYTKFCEDAIDFDVIEKTQHQGNLLYRSELRELTSEVENIRGKGGYFYEYCMENIEEFFKLVNEKYQTITYFGVDAEDLRQKIIQSNLTGIDRIVPIGKAMEIGVIWDGHDIVNELSRKISV